MPYFIVVIPALVEDFPYPIEYRNPCIRVMGTNKKDYKVDEDKEISHVCELETLECNCQYCNSGHAYSRFEKPKPCFISSDSRPYSDNKKYGQKNPVFLLHVTCMCCRIQLLLSVCVSSRVEAAPDNR